MRNLLLPFSNKSASHLHTRLPRRRVSHQTFYQPALCFVGRVPREVIKALFVVPYNVRARREEKEANTCAARFCYE